MTVTGYREYGSGYPGINGRGTAGRGFPFYFWPVVWTGSIANSTTYAYLDPPEVGDTHFQRQKNVSTNESTTNTSRPGGALTFIAFTSTNFQNATTLRILSDDTTINELIEDMIRDTCRKSIQSPKKVVAYNESSPLPRPLSHLGRIQQLGRIASGWDFGYADQTGSSTDSDRARC
ncbi:hypothetical protein AX17_003127 [Amanita inopinata Kibby_2008]|nr:hypothetical protein AX17_003127 [Amanita inopinata Kibby_2008]